MKHVILIIISILFFNKTFSQRVYVEKSDTAKVNFIIFVTHKKSEANCFVYKTRDIKLAFEAINLNETYLKKTNYWYFTKKKSEADFIIRFTRKRNLANLFIRYTYKKPKAFCK